MLLHYEGKHEWGPPIPQSQRQDQAQPPSFTLESMRQLCTTIMESTS
jgi:hypothetical protein